MKRIQIAKPKARRERSWQQPIALGPRDPDIARVTALARATSNNLARSHRR